MNFSVPGLCKLLITVGVALAGTTGLAAQPGPGGAGQVSQVTSALNPAAQPLLQIAVVGFPVLSIAGLLVVAVKGRRARRSSAERENRLLRECLAHAAARQGRAAAAAPLAAAPQSQRPKVPLRKLAGVGPRSGGITRSAESYWAYQARQLERTVLTGSFAQS